ncbi:DUF2920 family protein [Desulfovibrio sp. JC010]|uniref:DUF2920 family protein n=1 Tax=Desulfovibrio sp. JC010 TaxID=2593641 RepID=UPI0013D20A66|nr:DUF2920 family protein [Desulfovibrio sp. JC010]
MVEHNTIPTSNDFELNGRDRKVSYNLYGSENKNGLVVYIPGFGADLGDYTDVFCKKISSKYNLAALSVEYFGINSRPNVGAKIDLEIEDRNLVQRLVGHYGDDWAKDVVEFAGKTGQFINLTGSLTPSRGEYQNFGLLPALDILNSIRDAVMRYDINENNIILIGSSYGGYLANMVSKIAPGYLRAVFDNSSWAVPNHRYLVGRELGQPEFAVMLDDMVRLNLFVKSPWTLKPGLPNSLEKGKLEIRSFSPMGLADMAAQGAGDTCYFFIHSSQDSIAPLTEKLQMEQEMQNCGFKHVLLDVVYADDVDGEYIKSLDHGLGLSMLTFFERSYKKLCKLPTRKGPYMGFRSEYRFDDSEYCFDFSGSPVMAERRFI